MAVPSGTLVQVVAILGIACTFLGLVAVLAVVVWYIHTKRKEKMLENPQRLLTLRHLEEARKWEQKDNRGRSNSDPRPLPWVLCDADPNKASVTCATTMAITTNTMTTTTSPTPTKAATNPAPKAVTPPAPDTTNPLPPNVANPPPPEVAIPVRSVGPPAGWRLLASPQADGLTDLAGAIQKLAEKGKGRKEV